MFPEVGAEVADRLTAAAGSGQYDELGDPEQLAARVTADLQVGNDDKHLRLKFHPDEVVDETDPVAEEAAWAARADLTGRRDGPGRAVAGQCRPARDPAAAVRSGARRARGERGHVVARQQRMRC